MAKPEYDLNNDCIVNQADLDLLMTEYGRSLVDPEAVAVVYREAESADTITDPMQISDDPDANGGQYIAVEPGNNSTGNPSAPSGVATYSITVPAGTYKIVGRVICPNGDDDSFWVRIQGATTQTTNDPSGWVEWNNIDPGSEWHWDVFHSTDDGGAEVEWTLAAGTHTLEIAYREDGALLDAFLITDDLAFDADVLAELAYDLNGDGTVDDADVALVMSQWLEEILWP